MRRDPRAPEDHGRTGRGIRHCGCLRVSLADERRQTGSASRALGMADTRIHAYDVAVLDPLA